MKETNNYKRLVELQKQYPELTYDNHGYDEISDDVVARHQEQIKEISSILEQEITDFVRFQNFKVLKNGTIDVRCQVRYDSTIGFIGVAYYNLVTFNEQNK